MRSIRIFFFTYNKLEYKNSYKIYLLNMFQYAFIFVSFIYILFFMSLITIICACARNFLM